MSAVSAAAIRGGIIPETAWTRLAIATPGLAVDLDLQPFSEVARLVHVGSSKKCGARL